MQQVEESGEQFRGMLDRAENYLESLLNDAFNGMGFQKINEILQEKEICPPQKYSKQLLNQLDKVLKKELDKNEFSNASLLLKCIQLFCRSDPQEAREFLSLIEPDESKFLINLVEDFFDTALIIGKSNAEGKKQLLESYIPYLGHLVTESTVNCALRQEALRTLNTLLDNVPREERKKFASSEEIGLLTKELAKAILDVGDYDIQVAILEALFRLLLKKWRDNLSHNWFEDQHIAKAFTEIKDRDFETDCRTFLNELNEKLGDKRRVRSLPCKAARADMNKLKKPTDDKLEEFWIDFNFGSESVTFYVDSPEEALWESVRLPKGEVSSYSLQEATGETILKILMNKPTTINKKETTKIKLHFDSQFDVLSPANKVLGKDKMVQLLDKGDIDGDQPQQDESAANSHLEQRKDPVDPDSISHILSSQLCDQSVTTTKAITPTDVTATKESQQMEKGSGSPGQAPPEIDFVNETASSSTAQSPPSLNTTILLASPPKQKGKTIEPRVDKESDVLVIEALSLEDDVLEKTPRTGSASKQIKESEKDVYEFGNATDPEAHQMVTEMKQMLLTPRSASHRHSKKVNLKRSKSERSLSASYKKHLFSESNLETASNGASEKSWILDSQKKPVQKSLDYSRKKPRIRSNLKVLPLSSPSSGSDQRAKKIAAHREMKMRRMKSSKGVHYFSAVPQTGISSTPLLHTGQSGPEIEDATLPLSGISSSDYSYPGVSKEHEIAGSTLRLDDKLLKSKRKLSDLTVDRGKKRSKLAERSNSNDQSPSIPFEPRKLFSSLEMEEEFEKGKNLGEIEDDVFITKILEEDTGDSGIIAAFEKFTSELEKVYWSRYKRMETYTHNTLKAPEQSVSSLLNQIHQCRLNELENFHKRVVQELTNLERRTQFLAKLEKNTVEFWTKQSNKLNVFCNLQIQRIQSTDALMNETTQ